MQRKKYIVECEITTALSEKDIWICLKNGLRDLKGLKLKSVYEKKPPTPTINSFQLSDLIKRKAGVSRRQKDQCKHRWLFCFDPNWPYICFNCGTRRR